MDISPNRPAVAAEARVSKTSHGAAHVTNICHGAARVTNICPDAARVTKICHGAAGVTKTYHGAAGVTKICHGCPRPRDQERRPRDQDLWPMSTAGRPVWWNLRRMRRRSVAALLATPLSGPTCAAPPAPSRVSPLHPRRAPRCDRAPRSATRCAAGAAVRCMAPGPAGRRRRKRRRGEMERRCGRESRSPRALSYLQEATGCCSVWSRVIDLCQGRIEPLSLEMRETLPEISWVAPPVRIESSRSQKRFISSMTFRCPVAYRDIAST